LLRRYQDGTGYADCYVTQVAGSVSQAAFVEAFYTSGLFKLERTILSVLASRPASDRDAQRLAAGAVSQFSAWYVEAQSPTELLLKDMTGRTRSWLMAVPDPDASASPRTHLYFGSAVVPKPGADGKPASMGWVFHALTGFHKLYSRLLLGAARRRVQAD
jgi:hypothetical protein